jgi:hypothetical protein
MFSAQPPTTDIERPRRHVRFVSNPDTEAEFTMRYMTLIHHDEVALAKARPTLRGDYAAGRVN